MDNPFDAPSGDPVPPDTTSETTVNPQSPEDSPKELTEAEKEALVILERDSKPPEPAPVLEVSVTEIPETMKIMQDVLAEYNYIESDIPLTHPKYWAAKRGVV